MSYYILIFLFIISLLMSVSFHVNFYLRAEKTLLLKIFLAMQGMIFIWIFSKLLIMISPNIKISWDLTVIEYFAIIYLGCVMLSFAYFLSNGKFLPQPVLITIVVIATFNFSMVLTNNSHHLFFSTFDVHSKATGPLFYFHTFFSYTIILIAYIYLIKGLMKNDYKIKGSTKVLLSIGLLLPFLANVPHVFKFIDIETDLTPVMFNFNFLVYGYAAYYYQFLDIKRITDAIVFENMQEGVLVLDNDFKIVKFNNAMSNCFMPLISISRNLKFKDLLSNLKPYVQEYDKLYLDIKEFINSDCGFCEKYFEIKYSDVNRCFLICLEKIKDIRKNKSYIVNRFIELTLQIKAVEQLEQKNEELESINQKLSEELSVTKELAITKERNEISKELHDILGHSLTIVISTLEMSHKLIWKNSEKAEEKLLQTKEIIRSGYLELKKSLEGNKAVKISVTKLIEEIKLMAEEVQALGTNVEVINRNTFEIINPKYYDTIYRICQEGLTNALRHGKAKNITIGIRLNENEIDIVIVDDGKGCSKLIKGNGLIGMEHRIKELKGVLSCGSPEGEGFNLHVKIPMY